MQVAVTVGRDHPERKPGVREITKMIEIQEMDNKAILALLRQAGFGHLGFSRGNVPYVVPMHYAYILPYVYVYTTEGKKVEILAENPEVCLQIEKISSNADWQSVIINGRAEAVLDPEEREKALAAIIKINPTLTPALSVQWMDNWVRENHEVVYRIEPYQKSGRRTNPRQAKLYARPVEPNGKPRVH
jgi:uncharacterized protein